MSMQNLDYALGYRRLGWHVLPTWSVDSHGQCRCGRPNDEKGHKPGKHPQHHLVPNGHHDATLEEDTIREWWATDPDAGIGINLSASGLLALDIDPKNGGWETLAAIEAEHGVLHSDCVAVTQGAGEHRVFRADSALSFPGKLGPGLDLKHHGYICVAPTLGPSGEYKWAAGHSPLSKTKPAIPSELPTLIASKGRAPTSYSLTERGGVPVATAQTFDDLRSALKYVDADDYEAWVNVGMVLKPYGENGYKVWTEWSERSDKFDAAAQRKKWDRDLDQPHSITYRSIFRAALDAGWTADKGPPATTGSSHPLGHFLSFGEMSNKPREFVLDNIMVAGIVIVAGYHGAGKTSQLVPLMCHAAHLCGHGTGLLPTLRRRVIYVAEEPHQVFETLDAMRHLGLIPNDNDVVADWFKVVKAVRLQPETITQITGFYRQLAHLNHHPTNGTSFEAMPIVVFDTANASIDIENESDNAEVGRAIAELKREFGDIPIIIVTHTGKGTKSQDRNATVTSRGASAWEADAHQVIYLKHDDTGRRKLDIAGGKHRFSTRVQAIEFITTICTAEKLGILGDLEESTVVFGMPQISTTPEGVTLSQQATAVACEVVIAAIRQTEATPPGDLSLGIALTPLVDKAYLLAQLDMRAKSLTRAEIKAAIQNLVDKNILTICKASGGKKFYRLTEIHDG